MAPKLGLMLVPYIVDVLSKKMEISRVLALNVNGLKLDTNNIGDHVSGYIFANSQLGITPDFVWRDDQQENVYWIRVFFHQLEAEGYIRKELREILRCPCGVVETLSSADNISDTRKLYDTVDGNARCRICKKSLIKEIVNVYLFKIPRVPINRYISPEFTRREIHNMSERFSGLSLLISRTRDTAISLWTGKEHIYLDADFGWQMYLPILCRFGYQPVALIGSQKNLFGCYLAMVLSFLIDKTMPGLIVPAYCKVNSSKDVYQLDSFADWGQSVTRLYLASHCTFQKKEVVFDTSSIRLVSYVVRRMGLVSGPAKRLSLSEAVSACEGKNIRKALFEKRANRTIDESIFSNLL